MADMTPLNPVQNLITDVYEELKAELEDEVGFDENKLLLKVRSAYREVKNIRRYQSHYTAEMIASDMEQYFDTVKDVARYDYNLIGAEGESVHSENGVSRTYVDRNKLFGDVLPLASL